MNSNTPKILYFTESMVPTAEELLEIESLGFKVQVRNVEYIHKDDKPEPCVGVLGTVPSSYDHLPDGDKVMADFKRKKLAELEAMRKGITADEAPKKRERKAKAPNAGTFTPGAQGDGKVE